MHPVAAVADDAVTVLWKGRRQALANDAVIVCIGGRLPTELMSSIGVAIATRRGTP